MNEKEFSTKIKPWLDRTASQVGELQATRLKAARLRALDAYREPVRVLGLVSVSGHTLQHLHYSVVQRSLLWLPLIIFLGALAFLSANPEPDVGELDAQLLTQELPPDAFLDKEFRSWLRDTQG